MENEMQVCIPDQLPPMFSVGSPVAPPHQSLYYGAMMQPTRQQVNLASNQQQLPATSNDHQQFEQNKLPTFQTQQQHIPMQHPLNPSASFPANVPFLSNQQIGYQQQLMSHQPQFPPTTTSGQFYPILNQNMPQYPPQPPPCQQHYQQPPCPQSTSSVAAGIGQIRPQIPVSTSASNQSIPQRPQLQPQPKFIQKVQMWNQWYPFPHDSGVHSMSSANSLICSSIHPPSRLSTVSTIHDDFSLNINELNEEQRACFQNISTKISISTPEAMREVMAELLPFLSDESDENIIIRVGRSLRYIAKYESEHVNIKPIIVQPQVITGILRFLKMHINNKTIVKHSLNTLNYITNSSCGLRLILRTIKENGPSCMDELIYCINDQNDRNYKYVIIILHTLMVHPEIGSMITKHARELRIMIQLLGLLGIEKDEKLLCIIIDVTRLLVDSNIEQKALFLSLNGHIKLIHIIKEGRTEKMLTRAIKLLGRVSEVDCAKLVEANSLEAMHEHLDHPSQRLIHGILSFIMDVSHVPTVNRDLTPLLTKLLQFLGTDDIDVNHFCINIICNLLANNPRNKEFLIQNGIVSTLFLLFREMENFRHIPNVNPKHLHIMYSLEDQALTILRGISFGNSLESIAQQQIMLSSENRAVLLKKLIEMNVVILRKILRILCLVSTNPECLRALHKNPHEANSYISQVLQILHTAIFKLPSRPEEGNATMIELINYCLNILKQFGKDSLLLQMSFRELCQPYFLVPFNGFKVSLPQVAFSHNELAKCAVNYLFEMARIPEGAMLLKNDPATMNRLQMYAMPGNDLASTALQTLKLIQSGGDFNEGINVQQLTSPHQEEMFSHQAQQQTMQMQPNSVESSAEVTSTQLDCSGQHTSLTSSREGLCFSDELLEHSTNGENANNATTQLSVNLPNGLDSYEDMLLDEFADFSFVAQTFCQ